MRNGRIAVFALGFACGMAVLAIVLWASGALHPPRGTQTARAAPVQPATTSLPPPTAESGMPVLPRINDPIPAWKPAPPPPLEGEADRAALEAIPDNPIIPVEGVSAKKLIDTFQASRDGRKHNALDIMAPRGTPVLAAVEGNVVKLFHSKLGGVTVYQFDDSQTYCYYYAHLDHYASGLAEGTLLRKGQVLAYVGSTGNASSAAPHLHFEIHKLGPDKKWWTGLPIDPFEVLKKRN